MAHTRVVQVWSDFLGESERGGQQSDILERTLRYMVMCDYTPLSLAAGNLLVRQFRCAPPPLDGDGNLCVVGDACG